MNGIKRPFSLSAALLFCLSCSQEQGEILWDRYGIPHIFAHTEEELFYGVGWAQMRNHANLMLKLYGEARGRAAEYWGKEHLESDRWMHLNGVPERSGHWLAEQSERSKGHLAAFVRGINAYAEAHRDKIDPARAVVLPVREEDILGHVQRVIHFSFVIHPMEIAGVKRQWEEKSGSNTWAVAPKRSASGNALLLANPHLPWSDYYSWFEHHVVLPQLNAYGATLVGMPTVGIMFTDHLGWTHTVNTHDGADLYALKLEGGGYRFDGEIKPFEVSTKQLKVKQDDGSIREEVLTVKRSVHGPVVAEKGGDALALRVVGLDMPHVNAERWKMLNAKNFSEFQKALKTLQMPMFTVMYADQDGHIMHLFGGLTPRRNEGWDYSGIVPGDTSATLWTEYHRYEELPKVIDPPTGWLQNANDPPWTTTFPEALDADDFPSYMAPRFMHFRAQQSAQLMMDDDNITVEEFVQYKFSTRMLLADRVLDDLIQAGKSSPNELTVKAASVLAQWDRHADNESRGAVLFKAWADGYGISVEKSGLFVEPWREGNSNSTPHGLANPEGAAEALGEAARKVVEAHGALDVAWGEVFRLRKGTVYLPANGAPGDPYGVFRVTGYGANGDGTYTAGGGDSYVAVVEFSNPVKAYAVLGAGNASQPSSPHITDQLELFSEKRLRPVWLTRKEIEANLKERKVF